MDVKIWQRNGEIEEQAVHATLFLLSILFILKFQISEVEREFTIHACG